MRRVLLLLLLAAWLLPVGAGPAAALSPDDPVTPVDLSAAQVVLIFVAVPLLVAGLVWALVTLPKAPGRSAASLQGPFDEGPLWVNPPVAEVTGGPVPAESESGGAGARW